MKIGNQSGFNQRVSAGIKKLQDKVEDGHITVGAVKLLIKDGLDKSSAAKTGMEGLYIKNTPVKLTRGGVAKSAGLGLLAAGIISLYGMPPLGVAATGGLFFFYALERLCPDKERMPEEAKSRVKPEATSKQPDPALVKEGLELLKDRDQLKRMSGLQKLVLSGDEKQLPNIAKGLQDEDHVVRGVAAYCLEKTGSRRAVPYLTEFLRTEHNREEKDWYNRRQAVNALGTIGGKEAVKTLIGTLEDESPEVREAAVSALKRNPDKNALAALAKYKIKQKLGKV